MTRRETVMKWWNNLHPLRKLAYTNVIEEFKDRNPKNLTGREIEKIYDWEHSLNTPKL